MKKITAGSTSLRWILVLIFFFISGGSAFGLSSHIATIELFGKPYDVYRVAPLQGIYPHFFALNNRVAYDEGPFGVEYVATAVGSFGGGPGSGDAATYSPEGGSSFLIPNRRIGEFSACEDINDNGVVIGWHHEKDLNLPPRAFIFSNTNGLRYLDAIFPAVKQLADREHNGVKSGTKGYQINNDGLMLITSRDGWYWVTAEGSVSPLDVTDFHCRGVSLNNLGQLPPNGGWTGEECTYSNGFINDNGVTAGTHARGEGANIYTYVSLNGAELSETKGMRASSLNNRGYIGTFPGVVIDPDGIITDLYAELSRQAPTNRFSNEWINVGPGSGNAVLLNDSLDIMMGHLYMRPACPDVTLSMRGTGIEFINGKVSVRVGNRYTVTGRAVNSGRGYIRNITVERPPGPNFFRLISGPTGFRTVLGPGESMEWVNEFEAIGKGSYSGTIYLRGESECGPVVVTLPVATEFVGEPKKIVVNSSADRGKSPNANCCDTGEVLENGEPECTLRAAIEAINGGCAQIIEFNIPGVAIPKLLPATPLPAITKPVLIDATTQSGGKVEITGSATARKGFEILGGATEIRGFVLNKFEGGDGVAILIKGSGKNLIKGNFIGLDTSGNAASLNIRGVWIDGSADNEIGGSTPEERNIIADPVQVSGEGANLNRIIGNWMGVGIDGKRLQGVRNIGVVIDDGNDNRVGGPGERGNLIAGFSEVAVQATRTSGTVIQGNRIGLDAEGKASGADVGILVLGTADAPSRETLIIENKIAGFEAGVLIPLKDTSGVRIEGNRIGLTFDGPGDIPVGNSTPGYGIRVDGAPDVAIANNVVAGHTYNILLAGTPQASYTPCTDSDGDGLCDDSSYFEFYDPENPREGDANALAQGGVIVEGNTVGLNAAGDVPEGAQEYGVVAFASAEDLTIRNNTIAGHGTSELWLVDGSRFKIAGNMIGTPDGVDRQSQVGVKVGNVSEVVIGPSGIAPGNIIGRNAVAGIDVTGGTNVTIRLNQIGLDPTGNAKWANLVGVRANGGIPVPNLKLEYNVVGGNGIGIGLNVENKITLQGNRVGVNANGIQVGNELGVVLTNTPAELLHNTIAQNGLNGLVIFGREPVLIESGPIYGNGEGIALHGILHEFTPFAPPTIVGIRIPPPSAGGKVKIMLAGIVPGTGGTAQIEIYGNREGELQGRTPLLRRSVADGTPFGETLEVEENSAFLTLAVLTATVTREGKTSGFSTATPILDRALPPVRVTGATDTDITLQWVAGLPVEVERAASPEGPWQIFPVTPVVVDGTAVATVPVDSSGANFFRLKLDL